jgi:predicted ATPase
VLDLLTCLVDKSLVLAEEHAGKGRYRLLEPIRQYAQEHLTALGECEAVRDRHSAHYLVLAEHSAAALWGSRVTGPFGSAAQLAWHARMEQDHDNLRAGLTWARTRASQRLSGAGAQRSGASGSCTATSTNAGAGWRQLWRLERHCRRACAPGCSGPGA